MSRNIKLRIRRAASAPRKKPLSPQTLPQGLSDSEGYSALEDTTDDEEEDVEAAEEKYILNGSPQPLSEPSPVDQHVQDEAPKSCEIDSTADDADAEDDDEEASWTGFNSNSEDEPRDVEAKAPAASRRVRFADDVAVSSNDSESTDSDAPGEIFPDLFNAGNALEQIIRRNMEHGFDTRKVSSDDSYRDFHDLMEPTSAVPRAMMVDCEKYLPNFSLEDSDVHADGTGNDTNQSAVIACNGTFGLAELDSGDETDTDDEAPMRRQELKDRGETREDSIDDTDTDTFFQRHGEPRAAKLDLEKLSHRHVVLFDPETKKHVTFTAQTVAAMDHSQNANPFYQVNHTDGRLTPEFQRLPAEDPDYQVMSEFDMDQINNEFDDAQINEILACDFSPPGNSLPIFDCSFTVDLSLRADSTLQSTSEFEESADNYKPDLYVRFDDEGSDMEHGSTPNRQTDGELESEVPILPHLNKNLEAPGPCPGSQAQQPLIDGNLRIEERIEFSGSCGVGEEKTNDDIVSTSPSRHESTKSTDETIRPVTKRKAPSESSQPVQKKQRIF